MLRKNNKFQQINNVLIEMLIYLMWKYKKRKTMKENSVDLYFNVIINLISYFSFLLFAS